MSSEPTYRIQGDQERISRIGKVRDIRILASEGVRRREWELKRMIGRIARIHGLPNVTATIDSRAKNGCKLTRDGISITINPRAIESLAAKSALGLAGDIPLAAADFIAVSHEVGRAYDFTRPGFYIELKTDSRYPKYSRHFFNTVIDDIAVDARLKHIPFAARYFDAYIIRLVHPFMEKDPLHVQMMHALKLYLLKKRPGLNISPEVEMVLGMPEAWSGILAEAATSLLDPKTDFETRHRVADELLYPAYCLLLERDFRRFATYQFMQSYDQSAFYGEQGNPEADTFPAPHEADEQKRMQALFEVIKKQDIDQLIKDRNEQSGGESDGDEDGPHLALAGGGSQAATISVDEAEIPSYETAANNWHEVIKGVAEVFIKLASPKESIAVPRYRPRRAYDGARMNPNALSDAYMQLETGKPFPIWQPIGKQIRHQELRFNGFDIYLLLDVSYSMKGVNAECAGAMGMCLMEGLLLARHQVELDAKQGPVDVRIQLMAFGSGWAELVPMSRELDSVQKENAYYNVLHPESYHTMVNGALRKVCAGACENPGRDALCIVISDGLFSDNLSAYKTVQGMPSNVYVGHINIGDPAGIPITLHFESIRDPRVLPMKLKNILQEYFEMIGQRY